MKKDINDIELKDGDVINIHQTVNGSTFFRIISVIPLNIVYEYDPTRTYEYDMEDLLTPFELNGEVDWEIVGNKLDINKK